MYQIISLLMLHTAVVSCRLSCIGENGVPVDMYIIYKLPEIRSREVSPDVREGKGYLYLDSNNKNFQLSSESITSERSSPGQTLKQVYRFYSMMHEVNETHTQADNIAHIFYNDENPEGREFFTKGHTKGALSFDKTSGFWMISSVPKYPPYVSDGYSYPDSGLLYGQMIICITFNASSFNGIGHQLRYNNPHLHDAFLPPQWEDDFPEMKQLLDGKVFKRPYYSNVMHLTSITGVDYVSFAKSNYFGKDLYFDMVAPVLRTSLLTETWQHGKVLGPSCNRTFTVVDITAVSIKLIDQHYQFPDTKDHSKFAIGEQQDRPYVCIGDINREPSQFKRGGGTICINDINLWKQFNNMVAGHTNCSG